MRRVLLLVVVCLFFMGCQNYVEYKIVNYTNYDVVLLNCSYVDSPEYSINANSVELLSLPNKVNLKIKNNTYPIMIENRFSLSSIKNMETIPLTIINQSEKNIVLKMENSDYEYKTDYEIEKDYQGVIYLYSHNPSFNLYYNNTLYVDYVYNGDALIIN